MKRLHERLRQGVVAGSLVVLIGGCGAEEAFDAEMTLSVDAVTTGWVETTDTAGPKIVPVISFALGNTSADRLGVLQVNGIFRRAGEELEWGSVLIRAVGSEGLPAGETAGPFTIESALGYTGQQPAEEKLSHGQFVDVEVVLFVKHRASQWVRLGTFDIARRPIRVSAAGAV